MAFKSRDGKSFTNRPPMMAHNRSMARMENKSAGGTGLMERSDPLGQPGEGGMEEDGHQIAQEHGPAHEVHVMHDHEGGQHHVMSMHPDGHQHQSTHTSAEKAHEHGKKLAGVGMEEHQEPDGDEAEPEYE